MRYFKLKDFFTSLNLFCSYLSIVLLFQGRFVAASILVLINVIFLDLLDGYVARLTGTFNDFGKAFDSITDFVGSSCITPFFIFFAYQKINFALALALGFFPLFTGVIRNVQSNLEKVSHRTYFIGFPRPMAGMVIVASLNSKFFAAGHYSLTAVLILIVSLLNVTHWPYIGNDKAVLKLNPLYKSFLVVSIVGTLAGSFFGYFWDMIVVFMSCYLVHPWITVEKDVWQSIQKQLKAYEIKKAS